MSQKIERLVDYYGFLNAKQEREIRRYYNKWKWILPPWCLKVAISMCGVGEHANTMAEAVHDEGYLYCRVLIRPQMFDNLDRCREQCFVHELAHALTHACNDYANRIARNFINDPATQRHVLEEIRERGERQTQWITEMLMQLG